MGYLPATALTSLSHLSPPTHCMRHLFALCWQVVSACISCVRIQCCGAVLPGVAVGRCGWSASSSCSRAFEGDAVGGMSAFLWSMNSDIRTQAHFMLFQPNSLSSSFWEYPSQILVIMLSASSQACHRILKTLPRPPLRGCILRFCLLSDSAEWPTTLIRCWGHFINFTSQFSEQDWFLCGAQNQLTVVESIKVLNTQHGNGIHWLYKPSKIETHPLHW